MSANKPKNASTRLGICPAQKRRRRRVGAIFRGGGEMGTFPAKRSLELAKASASWRVYERNGRARALGRGAGRGETIGRLSTCSWRQVARRGEMNIRTQGGILPRMKMRPVKKEAISRGENGPLSIREERTSSPKVLTRRNLTAEHSQSKRKRTLVPSWEVRLEGRALVRALYDAGRRKVRARSSRPLKATGQRIQTR